MRTPIVVDMDCSDGTMTRSTGGSEPSHWIREDEIEWISKISSGTFARVYKGVYKGRLVAVKMLKGQLDAKKIYGKWHIKVDGTAQSEPEETKFVKYLKTKDIREEDLKAAVDNLDSIISKTKEGIAEYMDLSSEPVDENLIDQSVAIAFDEVGKVIPSLRTNLNDVDVSVDEAIKLTTLDPEEAYYRIEISTAIAEVVALAASYTKEQMDVARSIIR
jgi:hypothetical protein